MGVEFNAKDLANLKRLASLPVLAGQPDRVSVAGSQLRGVIAAAEKGAQVDELAQTLRELFKAGSDDVESAGETWAGAMQRAGAQLEAFDKQAGISAEEPATTL